MDGDIPLKRDLTRRKRNSFTQDADALRDALVYNAATNVASFLRAKVESETPLRHQAGEEPQDHSAALHRAMTKGHMLDLGLVGRGGAEVRTSRFVLACYSSVLEEVFFQRRRCPHYHHHAADARLTLDFCSGEALAAAVHHCFRGDLPPDFSLTAPSADVARTLAQLDRLAHVYRFRALGELTYRALRKLINQRPVLACAIFDELSYEGEGGEPDADADAHAPGRRVAVAVDSIKRYALDTLREMPMDTLLAGGVQWMTAVSVEAIMRDQDIEVDEFFMFNILHAWASHKKADRLPVARRLSRHIELRFIDADLLATRVAASRYFTPREIAEAVRLIRDSLAARDPGEMERVLVEGAGTDAVNGIYCRVEEEVGLGEEEVLFVKETDDGIGEMGLYLYGTKWHVAMCTDYSNCFYSCDHDPAAAVLVPPGDWYVQYGGAGPPPYCTYLPITRMGRGTTLGERKSIMAPNLEEMIDPTIAEKRRSGYFDKRTDDVVEKRTMTLEQMMHLPEDRGGED